MEFCLKPVFTSSAEVLEHLKKLLKIECSLLEEQESFYQTIWPYVASWFHKNKEKHSPWIFLALNLYRESLSEYYSICQRVHAVHFRPDRDRAVVGMTYFLFVSSWAKMCPSSCSVLWSSQSDQRDNMNFRARRNQKTFNTTVSHHRSWWIPRIQEIYSFI